MSQKRISDKSRARCSAAAYMREQGMTYKSIGERMGVSPDRARQLCEKHKRAVGRSARELRYTREYLELLGGSTNE